MKVEDYSFGRIRIDGRDYTKDLWIIDGKITSRDKSISKGRSGTSHRVAREEVERLVTDKTRRLIIGAGNSGLLKLEQDAEDWLKAKGVEIERCASGELASKGVKIGEMDSALIHVTC